MNRDVVIGVLEDDPAQAELLTHLLERQGHQVRAFGRGADLVARLRTDPFDLLIVDWELPDTSGLDVLRSIRTIVDWHVPVLFVTQRDSEDDVVAALDAGADDYLIKEVRERELISRITSLLRRLGTETQLIKIAHVELDRKTRTALAHGQPVELTAKDFELAWYLFHNIGRLLSRQQLLRDVWGISVSLNTRTVDVHMSRLRRSLQFANGSRLKIRTVYQHGYRLELHEGNEPNGI